MYINHSNKGYVIMRISKLTCLAATFFILLAFALSPFSYALHAMQQNPLLQNQTEFKTQNYEKNQYIQVVIPAQDNNNNQNSTFNNFKNVVSDILTNLVSIFQAIFAFFVKLIDGIKSLLK